MRLLIVTMVFLSCNVNNKSAVVVHKLNKDSIQVILNDFTLVRIDTNVQQPEFYYECYYRNNSDSAIVLKILEDSLNNVTGINKSRNGINLFVAELYPNGQIKGDLPLNKDGEPDGLATYYYEDGRIKSKGYWKGYNQVGEWKNYDKNGNPEKTNQNSN